MNNPLSELFPALGRRLPRLQLGTLPTPVSEMTIRLDQGERRVAIKHDDLTATKYGGNKIRKLEYVFPRARERGAERIATFGAIASNHALATALYAKETGFDCTCFLSHQSLKPGLGRALRFHQQNETEIVKFPPGRRERVATMREHLQGRKAWVVPLGGSSWLGTVGFVNAALELVRQIEAGELDAPSRIYVALGTMGTAAGLALGFALAGSDIEVQAIRVTHVEFANAAETQALMDKTALLMHLHDPAVPPDLAARARIIVRDDFFGEGYGRPTAEAEAAIALAKDQLGIVLDSTYTGKTLAGMLHDLEQGDTGPVLFWNTYNSRPLDIDDTLAPDFDVVPREFERYYD